MNDLSNYRKSYEKSELLETNIPEDPINLFNRWFHEVEDFGGSGEVNAMTVSTIGLDGFPKSRVVLLKKFTEVHPDKIPFRVHKRAAAQIQEDSEGKLSRVPPLLAKHLKLEASKEKYPEHIISPKQRTQFNKTR